MLILLIFDLFFIFKSDCYFIAVRFTNSTITSKANFFFNFFKISACLFIDVGSTYLTTIKKQDKQEI